MQEVSFLAGAIGKFFLILFTWEIAAWYVKALCLKHVPATDLRTLYCYFIRPVLEYESSVWHSSLTLELRKQLKDIQRIAVNTIVPHVFYGSGLS